MTLAHFFTKIICIICTGFSVVIEWQKSAQKTTAQWHCHCVHTKSTETNFPKLSCTMPHCLSNMNVFLQSHCLKEKNITHGIGCKEDDLTFSTVSLSKSHSKLIWPLNMPCMPVALSKLLHTSKNSCTKSWIMPATVRTVVENSSIHLVSRVKLESLTC